MPVLKVILYSSQRSQRIIYQDSDGILTFEIEHTFLHSCEVEHMNTSWARVIVSDKTRHALKELEQKYDVLTGIFGSCMVLFPNLQMVRYFTILMKTKHL